MLTGYCEYDIFPLAFLAEEKQRISIRSTGVGAFSIEANRDYKVEILNCSVADEKRFPGSGGSAAEPGRSDGSGLLSFEHVFPDEGEYYIRIPELRQDLHVYALAPDMRGRYPFRGDLHMHSCRSDGRELPTVVAANYRAAGYDFTVISDHERYYPSLETRKALEIDLNDSSPLTDYLVVAGEEVHLPFNDAHYVNFGGRFSINALLEGCVNQKEAGDSRDNRSLDGNCPDSIPREEFIRQITERAKGVPRKIESERLSYAVMEWIYEQQQKAGGLGIFPHPFWRCRSVQISEDFLDYIYRNPQFDAFEVLGGESYFQHNGFQTAFYYEMRAKGYDYPVVGSTDSHGSTEKNRNGFICSTIVFAHENKTGSLVSSIKEKYSVAVDTISREYRLVGDFRLVKYGSFLLEHWYPMHDRLCAAEGVYLSRHLAGDGNARKVLLAMKGELPGMMAKYFNV